MESTIPIDSRIDTFRHKARVQHFLTVFATELMRRAVVHDDSKLVSPEVEGYDACCARLAGLTYGSEEYKANLRSPDIRDAIQHHYKHNSHHPEFHAAGIEGMSLADVVEMICDWLAATERQADGDILVSIEKNQGRFEITNQLKAILTNTVPLLKT